MYTILLYYNLNEVCQYSSCGPVPTDMKQICHDNYDHQNILAPLYIKHQCITLKATTPDADVLYPGLPS